VSRRGDKVFNGCARAFVGSGTRRLRHNDPGPRELESIERQAKNLAAWRIFAGKQVEGLIGAELHRDDSIFEMGELRPVAVRVHQVVRKLAAIAVRDRGEEPAPVITCVQENLRNAGEVFADDIGVLLGVGA
jgi:hypothetical protein